MQIKALGKTGLVVPSICLGTMTFGRQNSEAEAHAQLDLALARGISFLDAAEMYPVPSTPEREGLTLATKTSFQTRCRPPDIRSFMTS